MTVATALIPELDEIARNGGPELRAEAARRIAELFFQASAHLRPNHVDFFDEILIELVPQIRLVARAELAGRLSLVENAPRVLVGRLARENEILVAGPILRRSPALDEETLLEIARLKGQGHLLAMSERPRLSSDLTDVIVERGDREVIRRAAANAGAAFSESGYSELLKRASRDGVLTLTVGQRADLSDSQLKQLLAGSLDVVRRRLFESSHPSVGTPSSWPLPRSPGWTSGLKANATSLRPSAPSWRCTRPAISTRRRCSALPSAIVTRKRSLRLR